MEDYKSEMKLVSVYKAPDEFMAKTIESLLEDKNIKTVRKSYQVPNLDSIVTYIKGNWGEILVREEDFSRADELVKGFLS
ncbi:DUF2007 domain-containing protein [candidate division WOR-3 bacterium]|nr:DUF2007 domain-containing protein [candidate division WOR-3 bacterium]